MTLSKNASSAEFDLSKWRFDEEEALRAADFFPTFLTHVKAVSGPFHLEPWQNDLVQMIFGWKSIETGLRKHRMVYCEVPRKNGKTTLAAGIMLYMLMVDKERGAEVYSAATTRDQAGVVYEIASKMVLANDLLRDRCKVLNSKKRIIVGNSYFQSCSSEAGAIHGTNPHCCIFDELHEQPNRELWEAFNTGFGARDQPLFFSITTAGHDRTSLCWEQHQYAIAVMSGAVKDDQFLPAIFAADHEDDWTSPEVWEKANPSLGVSLKRDFLEAECKKAQEISGLENSFRRLHLNQWTEQHSRVIQMSKWDKCKRDYTESDFHGRLCYAGIDLASTRDVVALVLVFPEDDGGFSVLPWFWIPEENVDRRSMQDQRIVRRFAEQGDIETTEGDVIDVIYLSRRMTEIMSDYEVGGIGFDGWNADGPVQLMQEEGVPAHLFVKLPQSCATYNEPIKQLLGLLSSGLFRHNGNTVLRWMANNVSCYTDTNGNMKWDKGKSAEKIDGMSAMSMAQKLLISLGSEVSAYSQSGSGVILF